MNLEKTIEKLERMDDLIRRKATGTADEFANKLGICRSELFKALRALKSKGAPIAVIGKQKCRENGKQECRVIGNNNYRISVTMSAE